MKYLKNLFGALLKFQKIFNPLNNSRMFFYNKLKNLLEPEIFEQFFFEISKSTNLKSTKQFTYRYFDFKQFFK